MKKELNVLITAAGTQTMPGLADCLHHNGERKIRIIGADACVDSTLDQVVDTACLVPRLDDLGYLEALLEICDRENVDVFFPFMDEEMELIHQNLSLFEERGIKVALPSEEVIRITNDKLGFYQWMRAYELPVPDFQEINRADEIEPACRKLGYPQKKVCVKIRFSSGSRGVRILDADADLYDIFLTEKPNSMVTTLEAFADMCRKTDHFVGMMATEYLPGEECSVHMLARGGEAIYTVGWESGKVTASTPQECVLKELPYAFDVSRKIIRAMKLDGNIDFDFKYDENGIPKVMEANPRIAASMSVIAMGGINLPYLRIKQLLGEELPRIEPKYGVRMVRKYIDLFTDGDGRKLTWDQK